MCGSQLYVGAPSTVLRLEVVYHHDTKRWYAAHCAHSTDIEGGDISHGAASREFGPFDGAADVLQWLYGEARTLIKLMPVRDNLSLQVPPQGNEDGAR